MTDAGLLGKVSNAETVKSISRYSATPAQSSRSPPRLVPTSKRNLLAVSIVQAHARRFVQTR